MKKQKNNYESWFAGHYPSTLQDGKSYTDKNGCASVFTTRMFTRQATCFWANV
jgi:hypothetical protein